MLNCPIRWPIRAQDEKSRVYGCTRAHYHYCSVSTVPRAISGAIISLAPLHTSPATAASDQPRLRGPMTLCKTTRWSTLWQRSPTAQRKARGCSSIYSSHLPDGHCIISSAEATRLHVAGLPPALWRMTRCAAGARCEARDRRQTSRASPREPWCPIRRPSGTDWEQQRPQPRRRAKRIRLAAAQRGRDVGL